MSLNKPPSDALLARAAELRVTNATWEAIADEVGRAARTICRWPLKYPERWISALAQAEWFMSAQADCEFVHTLRRLLISDDEKIRWHAAKALINRRVERDKIELKTPRSLRPFSAPQPSSSSPSWMDSP